MNQTKTSQTQLNRAQQLSLIVGLVGLVICVVGFFISRQQFFQAYLLGYLFWIHIALGCVAAIMLHHLVGGRWGFVIRRFLEASAMTLPLMALLFVPIIFGMEEIYLWTNPEAVAGSELLQHKISYLNVPFFVGRVVLYFVIWIGLAYLLNRWSARQDETGEPGFLKKMKNVSGPGLILYMVTATFAAFDWMMSLEPEWFSSIYGVIFISGQALVTFAFVIILATLLSDYEPLSKWISADIYNDWGNFLLAFVAFWAYIAFSQYLIIWSANLPEEVTWYLRRSDGGWQYVALVLIAFHFSLPFAILLSRRAKRKVKILTTLAVFIVLMRFVDLFWLVKPAFSANQLRIHWLDIVVPIAIGGLWVAFFIWQLKRKALLPLNDPRFQEVPVHD